VEFGQVFGVGAVSVGVVVCFVVVRGYKSIRKDCEFICNPQSSSGAR
jgi:hypothetical protein